MGSVKFDGEVVRQGGWSDVRSRPGTTRGPDEAEAGDIVAITGIGGTQRVRYAVRPQQRACRRRPIDEPTVSMTFQVNASPFAGREGKYLTSRQIKGAPRARADPQRGAARRGGHRSGEVRGSGVANCTCRYLLENMRREGLRAGGQRPEVDLPRDRRRGLRAYEEVTVDVEEQHQGAMMEALGAPGELATCARTATARASSTTSSPRGLIGFQTEFMTTTSGTGLMYHVFDHYGRHSGGIAPRKTGADLERHRARCWVRADEPAGTRPHVRQARGRGLRGQIVGIHSRDNDLTVNPPPRQLTNIRPGQG